MQFDPYQIWLDIPPSQQPPNLYRLFSLRPLEADPNLIESSANQAIARVEGYRAGPNRIQCEQLISELQAAKATLLDPAAKSRYDAQLSGQVAGQPARGESPLPHAPPPPGMTEQQIASPAPPVPGSSVPQASVPQERPVQGSLPTSPAGATSAGTGMGGFGTSEATPGIQSPPPPAGAASPLINPPTVGSPPAGTSAPQVPAAPSLPMPPSPESAASAADNASPPLPGGVPTPAGTPPAAAAYNPQASGYPTAEGYPAAGGYPSNPMTPAQNGPYPSSPQPGYPPGGYGYPPGTVPNYYQPPGYAPYPQPPSDPPPAASEQNKTPAWAPQQRTGRVGKAVSSAVSESSGESSSKRSASKDVRRRKRANYANSIIMMFCVGIMVLLIAVVLLMISLAS